MNDLLLEIGFLALLGVLYYFYQRRKILHHEENREVTNMGFILHSLLAERGDNPDVEMDTLIEALDDFLSNKTSHPPKALLKIFAQSEKCSAELREIILEGLD